VLRKYIKQYDEERLAQNRIPTWTVAKRDPVPFTYL